ncbi:CCA tRNA nucleotidyltransferase [Kordiimonas pumila]|uniref:CCA tRNA nucleotidyltransferase n=1 Tax=Kordiimonas pumila TaxID=2161677 RepID=A0ABV7D8W0_9PROT|nr:CCA tRNA nucleotidyltransferase [Kordiimonas pumila]
MQKIKADWLDALHIKMIVTALGEQSIRFVGGAVRDTLMGRPVQEVDAATTLIPCDVIARLGAAGIKAVPTGVEHGTVTAVVEGKSVEITTLRRDTETDGRHAVVAYTDSWKEDAKRRDFTMNAVYMDAAGTVFDPLDGIDDVVARRVRFIGDAAMRIEEDALRILRFFRFNAVLGTDVTKIDAEGLSACSKKISLLENLSVERIRSELIKIFSAPKISALADVMESAGVFQALQLKVLLTKVSTLEQNECKLGQQAMPEVRLFYCLGDIRCSDAFSMQLRLSNKMRAMLKSTSSVWAAKAVNTDHDIRKLMYQYGAEAVQQAGLCSGWNKGFQEIAQKWHVPVLPVQGKDIIAQGVLPGPEIGAEIRRLEGLWVESDFTLTKAQLIHMINTK